MNKMFLVRMVIGVVCIALGVFFFRFQTDQEFARLTPTEESKYLVPMKSGVFYDQDFLVHNKLISRIGLYFLPLHPLLGHTGTITVALMRNDTVLQSGEIRSDFIDQRFPSEVRFARPVATAPNDILKLRVTVSDGISGDIALRNRVPDSDFTADDIWFRIDGVLQENPIAYTAFTETNPAFIKQLGVLVVLVGLITLAAPLTKKRFLVITQLVLVAIAGLQAISAFSGIVSPILHFILSLFIVVLSWWILRIAGRSMLSSFFGASIFAGSSWLPLLLITRGASVGALSFRDTFFDPNQIAVSHATGAYVGFFAGFFALVGILIWVYNVIQMPSTRVKLETLMVMVLGVSLFFAFARTGFQMPRASIVVVMSFAWFASLGLHEMERFLGNRDMFVRVCIILLLILCAFDLMHVTATTFAYGI